MSRQVTAALLGTFLLACGEKAPDPTAPMTVAVYGDAHASANANGGNFGTPLVPEEEVMPAGVTNTSTAVGNAILQLSQDGQSLSYKLIVANISNAFMAHIHTGPAGTNGLIGVWLYPSTAVAPGAVGGGRLQGVIAEGTITSANFINQLAGKTMADFVALIKAGGAYVNVHTNDGVAPTNTGPGDYPAGEVRGKIEARGNNK
jgi:hypothetical protein